MTATPFLQVGVQRQPSLPDQIADTILDFITQRQLVPGQKLPPERELCERFGVSRTAVREAIRSLNAKGLVDVRAGGGVWVRQPSMGPAAELIGIAVQTAGGAISWAEVLETRLLLEVEMAGLAAERRTEEDLVALREAVRKLEGTTGDAEAGARADIQFHDSLAVASHNGLMPILLGAMQTVLLRARQLAYRLDDTLRDGVLHHGRILARIEAGDGDGARDAMLEHLRGAAVILTHAQRLPEVNQPDADRARGETMRTPTKATPKEQVQ